MNVLEAVSTLKKAFKDDPDFRYAYQANIAMAIKDEYSRVRKKKKCISYEDMHEIANKGADDFLTLFCK